MPLCSLACYFFVFTSLVGVETVAVETGLYGYVTCPYY